MGVGLCKEGEGLLLKGGRGVGLVHLTYYMLHISLKMVCRHHVAGVVLQDASVTTTTSCGVTAQVRDRGRLSQLAPRLLPFPTGFP